MHMPLISCREEHLETVMTWVTSAELCYAWAGPDFRYPFTQQTFAQDLHLSERYSYVLLNDASEVVAFGQCLEKAGRCHLSRLIVAPQCRGVGYGQWLTKELMRLGRQALNASEYSLFVLRTNKAALACYLTLGFCETPMPEEGLRFGREVAFMVCSSG